MMVRSVVSVVRVGDGRFAILMLDPAAAEPQHRKGRSDDPHGYTEAELRSILSKCYRLTSSEIEERIAVARS
ncbi:MULTISPECIES: hypothetical protein [unclassified Acidisoma]|jgi:hypothetical protein|uniref:hypothetical protein n=1 Tax=unclassified Acidisoma TaxID=2634065 RepID=UPI00131B4073|nr:MULTISPECIES: hypothetical protein [unclassified Acidisoma]